MARRFALFFTAFLLLNIHSSKASNPNEDSKVGSTKRTKANELSILNVKKWEELPSDILNMFLRETLINEGVTIIRLSLTNKNMRKFVEQRCETLDLRDNDLSTDLLAAINSKRTVNLETFINLEILNVSGCNLTMSPRLSSLKKCTIINDDEDLSHDIKGLKLVLNKII